MNFESKFPAQETTIFTVMSALANECGAINLSQGFPNFEPDPLLLDLVHSAAKSGYNQYAPMAGHPGLRRTLADKHAASDGCTLDPETEITITAGATQGLFTAISALVCPGEEVLYFEPAYDCYRPAIALAGAVPVPVQLTAPDFHIDWDAVRKRINAHTRMIIVNTPNNPGCYTWKAADWEHLEELVTGRDIIVLSDEVYEHIVYDEGVHRGVLSRPALREQSLAVFSFGKNFHVTGWKVGYIAGSRTLMDEFRKLHQYIVFSVHHPTQHGIAAYLTDPSRYLDLSGFFREKYETFLEASTGSSFRFLPSGGSYFVLADYSAISDMDDRSFAKWMTREIGVATIPLSPFYSSPPADQRLVRFCFAKTDELLQEAGERLRKL